MSLVARLWTLSNAFLFILEMGPQMADATTIFEMRPDLHFVQPGSVLQLTDSQDGHSTHHWCPWRATCINNDSLLTVGQKGPDPVENRTGDAAGAYFGQEAATRQPRLGRAATPAGARMVHFQGGRGEPH